MEELNLVGIAQVVAIEACPSIADGKGRVVTATFTHKNPLVLDIQTASGASFETTRVHRFYSESRKTWVSAKDLKQGEFLSTPKGPTRITSIEWKWEKVQVYNIEVEFDHSYFVTDQNVLTHDSYQTSAVQNTRVPKQLRVTGDDLKEQRKVFEREVKPKYWKAYAKEIGSSGLSAVRS